MRGRFRAERVALLAAVALVASTAMALALPAGAATVSVGPGQSIQAAIDAAPPGSTVVVRPGVYHENLVIQEDSITLQGSGRATVLEPPAIPNGPCARPDEDGANFAAPGICVLGDMDQSTGPPTVRRPVTGVRVLGLTVRGFLREGILVLGGRGTVIQGNALVGNREYGILVEISNGTVIAGNTAAGSRTAGIWVAESPRAGASIRANELHDNGFGVLLHGSSVGLVEGNRVHDNCAGIALLQGAISPVLWTVAGNEVNHNNRACPAGPGPPFSGIGIVVDRGFQNAIHGNVVNDNVPAGPSLASGGIVLRNGSSGNSAIGNNAHRNMPVDLADDSGGPNRFSGNSCQTSRPAGLCQFP